MEITGPRPLTTQTSATSSATGDDAGIAKITINRPEVRNAFRPETVIELSDAFTRAREDLSVGVVILTGEGPERSARAAISASAAAAAAT